jgi:hypothetical protein
MNSFWIAFIVNQAVAAAEAFIATSKLNPAVKAALGKFIAAGQALANALGSGSTALIKSLAVPFNPAQLATWAEAMALVKVINGSAQFQAAGLFILPQDPAHIHSGAYIPSWVSGPGGFQEPVNRNQYFIHFRYSNKFEGMNAGLVREKFASYPDSPAYVLGTLLAEVQQGANV